MTAIELRSKCEPWNNINVVWKVKFCTFHFRRVFYPNISPCRLLPKQEMVLYFKSNVGEHFWRVFHPNISNICRQPKQESVRFAGAPVLSSSKGEYWKVHYNDDEEDEDYEEVGHLIRDGRVDVLLAEVYYCSVTIWEIRNLKKKEIKVDFQQWRFCCLEFTGLKQLLATVDHQDFWGSYSSYCQIHHISNMYHQILSSGIIRFIFIILANIISYIIKYYHQDFLAASSSITLPIIIWWLIDGAFDDKK